jgi:hypothetical protein
MNWNPFKRPARVEPEIAPLYGLRTRVGITFQATVTVDREMMGALDALVGYGDDAFIKAFKEKLGVAYIGPYETGLKRFFKAIRDEVLPAFHDVQQAERDMIDARRKRAEARDAKS